MNGPHTPGFFGYLVALLASWLTFGLGVALLAVPTAADPAEAFAILLGYPVMIGLYAAVLGLPVAVTGVLLVHLVARRVAAQWVHVVTAGVVGAVLTVVYLDRVLDVGALPWFLPVAVGMAAAVGRVVVLPLVGSRRRLATQGSLTGTARW